MSDRDALSGTDNVWLQMGSANNLTDITGVLWLDEPITYEELCDRLERRLLRFDRLYRLGLRSTYRLLINSVLNNI